MEVRMTKRAVLPGIVALALAVGLLSSAPAPASAALHVEDLYFRAGYERQVDSRTCIAASTAMMLNFIARRDLNLNQTYILKWAQARDTLNDRVQRGSDPLGWARALTYFSTRAGRGAFTYRWESYSTEYIALKHAARVIAEERKPVGLLVQNGRHAVVMTGFEATGDPERGDFKLINVWISDPYGSRHRRYAAAASPLNTYRELDAIPPFYDKVWYGRYVIVAPPI
jgi:hypothetical protein